MNALPQTLPPPDSFDQSSSMWVDEAIWGHRLYDEQMPWIVSLIRSTSLEVNSNKRWTSKFVFLLGK